MTGRSTAPVDEALLYTDGAARGNPGPAGAGAVLLDPRGNELAALTRYLGKATNNVAEYQALILGLEEAAIQKVRRLKVHLDSELVVRQLNGQYKVRNPHLKPLYQRVLALLRAFDQVSIIHVRREFNRRADQLANQAIDQAD